MYRPTRPHLLCLCPIFSFSLFFVSFPPLLVFSLTHSHPSSRPTSPSSSLTYPTTPSPSLPTLLLGPKLSLVADPTFHPKSPVVWYGTSILQGGVASRPGQAFTNILSRDLDVEILNFGFSGNGVMELSVAQFLTALPAAAFIIDCNWNMNGSLVAERIQPLVHYLRANGHADTPILLAEGTNAGAAWYSSSVNASRTALRSALTAGYNALRAAGDTNLVYVPGDPFYNNAGDNYTDPTVGGTHPTDLGSVAVASVYRQLLPPILAAAPNAGKPFSPVNYTVHALQREGESARRLELEMHLQTDTDTESQTKAQDLGLTVAAAQHAVSEEHRRSTLFPGGMTAASDPASMASTSAAVDFNTLFVGGRAFNDTAAGLDYSRLPASAEGVVRDNVWTLSLMSTGMYVRFVTDSRTLAVNWCLTAVGAPLWHMPESGTSGLDLYAFDVVTSRWRHVAVPKAYIATNEWTASLLETGANTTCVCAGIYV